MSVIYDRVSPASGQDRAVAVVHTHVPFEVASTLCDSVEFRQAQPCSRITGETWIAIRLVTLKTDSIEFPFTCDDKHDSRYCACFERDSFVRSKDKDQVLTCTCLYAQECLMNQGDPWPHRALAYFPKVWADFRDLACQSVDLSNLLPRRCIDLEGSLVFISAPSTLLIAL